jgi:hypothetical protein
MIKPLSLALVGLALVAGAAAKPVNRSAAAGPHAGKQVQAAGTLPVQLSSSAILFYDCGAQRDDFRGSALRRAPPARAGRCPTPSPRHRPPAEDFDPRRAGASRRPPPARPLPS